MLYSELQPPTPPERPKMPYLRFCNQAWKTMKEDNPELKFGEIGKMIGQKWTSLDDEEKQKYIDPYEAERAEYRKASAIYLQSPKYQAYLAAKEKRKVQVENAQKKKVTGKRETRSKKIYSRL